MKNVEIVKVLQDIADLLDIKGESVFKVRAYQKAARSIEFLSEDVEKLVNEDRLREIPGVGDAIAKKLTELVTTGRLEYYEKLRQEFPQGIETLLEVPGIGPRTALLLIKQLGISTIDDLEKAIDEGRVARLPHMGEKTAQNILHQIQAYRRKKSELRMPLGTALPAAASLMEGLSGLPGLKNLTTAGSLRRFRDTIGDIDLMGTADDPAEIIRVFTALPQIKEVVEKGSTRASVIAFNSIPVDLRLVDHASFGSLLQYSTGSKQHNIDLRTRAERLGLSLSEYGITNMVTGEIERFASEEEFYRRQGLDYIPPEIREAQGEIELAEKGALPRLIEQADIMGDLHLHTDWSDGAASLEEMARAAEERGYQYIAITDHSAGLGIARGLSTERIQQQIQAIKEFNSAGHAVHVFTGMEVDIRANGTLDMPIEILSELDIVLASVHSSMNQSEAQMTARIIAAIENPYVDVICHPTCRLLGERDAVAVDMEAVCRAAVRNNTALEINSMPSRLDLKDTHIHLARNMGVRLIINTDSHRTDQLDYIYLGIGIARRGWCEAKDILNTLPLQEFQAFLSRRKPSL